MTILQAMLSFAAVAGLLTIDPGLDTAMVLRSTVASGRRHGFATAAGVSTGGLIWGVAAAVGISALLTASTIAYTIVRVMGAVYMIWMGARLLRGAARDQDGLGSEPAGAGREVTAVQSWRRGLATNLLNPKVGAFYLAVLPQFIPAHSSHLAVGLLLTLVLLTEGVIWFSAIIVGAHTIRTVLERRQVRRGIDATTGATLLGFGLKLALFPK